MFTWVRGPEPHEDYGLSDGMDEDSTIIEVYLEDADLAFLRKNDLMVVRDPTIEDGIMVGAPTTASDNGLNVHIDGDVTATFAMKWRSQGRRIERQESTPVVYATAHTDGRSDSTSGTFVLFYHADEA